MRTAMESKLGREKQNAAKSIRRFAVVSLETAEALQS
jgi:hypothetical protein